MNKLYYYEIPGHPESSFTSGRQAKDFDGVKEVQ